METCAQWRGMSDTEVYTTWNGGQGMLVVLPADDVDEFIAGANSYKVRAQVCGEITPSGSAGTKLEIYSKYQGEKILLTP